MIQKLSETKIASEAGQCITWDQLWMRSNEATPLAMSNCLEVYRDGFNTGPLQKVLASRHRGQSLVAGLTLVRSRRWKLFREFRSPNNPWIQAGDLLVDQSKVTTHSFRKLAEQIKSLPCSLVTLDWADDSVEMERLIDELKLAGCLVWKTKQFETGLIRIRPDQKWDEYFAERSKGFRKKVRASLRKLQQSGEVKFQRHSNFSDRQEMHSLLESALAIEHSGWKGQASSSLNANPDAKRAYVRILDELAQQEMLEIQFLTVAGKPIAFEIGFVSHKTYYSHKIGFHPDFASFSPGQLLMYFQMQEWFTHRCVTTVDTVGELGQATAKWTNDVRSRYQYVIATRAVSGQALKLARWLKQKLKRTNR